MKPLITVVIPVYNCERYVARAIKSVLDQPCGDRAEILVVDDGSTDKSGEVCDRIASENSNVYVIHKENGGVSTARNLGIEKYGIMNAGSEAMYRKTRAGYIEPMPKKQTLT